MADVTQLLGIVIPKLALLLKEEYDLQTGVRKKITCLSRYLESMHAALCKVAEVPPEQLDEQVKLWARGVRELSYDVEDILDTFLVRVESRESRDANRFKRAAKKIGKLFSKSKARHQIASMIKIINEQAEEKASRRVKYRVDEIVAKPAKTSTVDPRLEAMYKQVAELVDIDKSSGDLISMLSLQENDESEKKMLKMVSVVGAGGLGKTTLAKAVYDKFKVDFECTAFVPVGRNPDLKKVLRDILIEFDRNKYMDPRMTVLDERQLIDELREFLGNKRYFVVIDDIWETKSWEAIKLALVNNSTGSRVITTTRKLDVAKQANQFYELQPLPYEKSRQLFYTRIFGAEGRCPDNQLDEVSDKILKKCDGVPLAIITMASLLLGKSKGKWIEVCNSIVFHKDNQQVSHTEWILSLSYYDLPAHLKTCLLYVSAFPEDYVIGKDLLIWKWVAEGFVRKEPGTRLFEVGEGYFNELINRSMIMAVESETQDIVSGCRVHDMVLDLLLLKSQEENFVTISSINAEGTSSQSRVRRLAHPNGKVDQNHQDSSQINLRHVRTFIACRCDIIDKGLSFLSYELLRMLALEDCKIKHHGDGNCLEHIENLLHVRYLGLRRTSIDKLPEGIGALRFLQTLDLRLTSFPKKLPSSAGLLTKLICLRAGYWSVPNGVIEKLTSLEDTAGQFVKDLGKLHELRVLNASVYITNTMNADMFRYLVDRAWDEAVLPQPLQYLSLPSFPFKALPSFINPSHLSNLTSLELGVSYLDEQGLKFLGGWPELRHLSLSLFTTVTATIHAADGFFQNLRSFSLPQSMVRFMLNEDSSISFMICWLMGKYDVTFGSKKFGECIVPAPAIMPNLQVLQFEVAVRNLIRGNGSCDNLGLEYLPSLKKVSVHFFCYHALDDEVEKEVVALRHATEVHPNRPTLKMSISPVSKEMDIFGKDRTRSQPVHHALATEDMGSLRADDDDVTTRLRGGGDPSTS